MMTAVQTDNRKKPVRWIGSSLKDIKSMPEEIQDELGRALLKAQWGGMAKNAEPMRGFNGANVIDIKERNDDSTYRLVYTIRFPNYVYVLHAFKKKSHHKIETPKGDVELIKSRLELANLDFEELMVRASRQQTKEVK